jgi:hypothetical protein
MVYGMVVALDRPKPLMRLYTGENVLACTNLNVFRAEHLFTYPILSQYMEGFLKLQRLRATEHERIEEYNKIFTWLNSVDLDNDEVNKLLGKLLRVASSKGLGTSIIVSSAKYLSTHNSPYYYDVDNGTTLYNVYNSMTQGITDSSDIFSKSEKSLVATELIFNAYENNT